MKPPDLVDSKINYVLKWIMDTIVISGATSGIGRATMMNLTARGFRVIGIGRSMEKIKGCTRALDEQGKGHWDFILADLSKQQEIRRAVKEIQSLDIGKIFCLINNAGSFASSYKETEDGLERQFAINHMAPFLLTSLLLPMMKQGGRIITVGSSSHFHARLHWKDPQMKKFYSSLGAYRQSKFFNILMTNELNKRFAEQDIRAYIADPGLVNTEIGLKETKGLSRLVWSIRRRKGQSAEEGAATSIFLAAEPDIEPSRGVYYKDRRPVTPDKRTADPELMARLWTLSESCVK